MAGFFSEELENPEEHSSDPSFVLYSFCMILFDTIEDISVLIGSCLLQLKFRIPNLIRYFQLQTDEGGDENSEKLYENDEATSRGAHKRTGEPGDLPRKLKTKLHEHELDLVSGVHGGLGFCCDHCFKFGCDSSYQCERCGFNLHPRCGLDNTL